MQEGCPVASSSNLTSEVKFLRVSLGVSHPLQGLTWAGTGRCSLDVGGEEAGGLVSYSQRPYLEAVEERINLTVCDVSVQLPCKAQRRKPCVPDGQM